MGRRLWLQRNCQLGQGFRCDAALRDRGREHEQLPAPGYDRGGTLRAGEVIVVEAKTQRPVEISLDVLFE